MCPVLVMIAGWDVPSGKGGGGHYAFSNSLVPAAGRWQSLVASSDLCHWYCNTVTVTLVQGEGRGDAQQDSEGMQSKLQASAAGIKSRRQPGGACMPDFEVHDSSSMHRVLSRDGEGDLRLVSADMGLIFLVACSGHLNPAS
jgi:hypothetical protein